MTFPRIGIQFVGEDAGMNDAMNNYLTGLDNAGEKTESTSSLVNGIFTGMGIKIVEWGATAVSAIADTFADIGKFIFDAGVTYDNVMDNMSIKTGATGEDLAALKDDFSAVFDSIPVDAETAEGAMSTLFQRFETTGPVLQDFSTNLLEASRMMGEDASANATAMADAMMLWEIPVEEGAGLLDKMFVASQQSGAGMGALTASISTSAPVLQSLGFTLDESIALLSQLEGAGINSSQAMAGLRVTLGKMSSAGIPVEEGFNQIIDSIAGATTEQEALDAAMEAFGTRAGPQMVAAIQSGAFEFEDFAKTLAESDGAIMDASESTQDFGEKLTVLKNKATTALEPLGSALMDAATGVVEGLAPAFETLMDLFTTNVLPVIQNTVIPVIEELVAVFSDLLSGDFEGALGRIFPPGVVDIIVGIKDTITDFFSNVLPSLTQGAGETIGGIWEETIKPAFESITAIWTESIQPTLGKLFTWFQTYIPQIIDVAKTFWDETLYPIFEALVGFISEHVVPMLAKFGEWFAETIPQIVDWITQLWTRTLQPALTQIWEALEQNIIPILEDLADWLGEKLPPILSAIWDILSEVIGWVVENVIPILADIVVWLIESIPDAINTVGGFLENLKEAFNTVWTFISENVIPIFTDVYDWLNTTIGQAIEVARGWWEDTLLPAITDVYDFITEDLLPVFEDVITTFQDVADEIKTFIEESWNKLENGIKHVKTAIEELIEAIGAFINAILSGDIESAWEILKNILPGSEPPLAQGAYMTADALDVLSKSFENLAGTVMDYEDAYVSLATTLSDTEAASAIVDTLTEFAESNETDLSDTLFSAGSRFSQFGSAVMNRYKKTFVDPLKKNLLDVEEQISDIELARAEAIEQGLWSIMMEAEFAEKLKNLESQRLDMAEEYEEAQARIAELQQAQADLQFLQQQMDFLKFLEEFGLDPADVLGGLQLGLDADLPALIEAMTRAIQEIIGAAEEELEIGSPSKRMARIFGDAMKGAELGIDTNLTLPQDAMRRAVVAISQPAMATSSIMNNISRNVYLNMGGVNLYGSADQDQFVDRVQQGTMKALRG